MSKVFIFCHACIEILTPNVDNDWKVPDFWLAAQNSVNQAKYLPFYFWVPRTVLAISSYRSWALVWGIFCGLRGLDPHDIFSLNNFWSYLYNDKTQFVFCNFWKWSPIKIKCWYALALHPPLKRWLTFVPYYTHHMPTI